MVAYGINVRMVTVSVAFKTQRPSRDRGVISPTVPSLFFITHAGAVKGGPVCTVLRPPLDNAVNAGEIRPHWVS